MYSHPFNQEPKRSKPLEPYKLFKSVLNEHLVQDLIQQGNQATIARYSEFSSDGDESTTGYERRGLVQQLGLTTHDMANCFLAANKHYKFNLYGMLNESYINVYRRGDYLDWHHDVSHAPVKLTGIVPLTSNYVGGELEVLGGGSWKSNSDELEVGDMIVFPSYLAHRVCKVKRGVRMSLGVWAVGERFR